MAGSFFNEILSPRFDPDSVLDISGGGKALIISDFHMGFGRRDDLQSNGEILLDMLENYYFKNGWLLVLNGDIEELVKFSFKDISAKWSELYRVFDLFAGEKRLYKILGNHDEDLVFKKDYPYKLHNALKIESGSIPIYVYHGHQASNFYSNFNSLIRFVLKFILKPIGIRNISSARSPHRRFRVEREVYKFSIENNCISIIGHTHRALFESLGRFDYIKFEIERLCMDYPSSSGAERERIAREVENLSREMGKLKRSERRDVLRQSLYGDDFPVPCLFNSGSAIGKKGINAIELDKDSISLVYWFAEGRGMKFISRGYYKVEKFGNHCRSVLNNARLDHVGAKIELLGRQSK